jgi:hypothetical protein
MPLSHCVFCSFINGPRDELGARDTPAGCARGCASAASWRVETAAAQEVQARNAPISMPQFTYGYAKILAHKKIMLASWWENPPPAAESMCSWQ